MYTDKDITLGYVTTDEAVQPSDRRCPSTAVFAAARHQPADDHVGPGDVPGRQDDRGASAPTRPAAWSGTSAAPRTWSYLIGCGHLDRSTCDGGYDGTPANFVAAQGKDAQQGFATAEPYIYENEVQDWGKPVAFQLIHDAGYPIYPEAMSVRTDDLETLTPCLEEARAGDAAGRGRLHHRPGRHERADPRPGRAVRQRLGLLRRASPTSPSSSMKKLELVGNGDNAYLGDFDEARMQWILDVMTPISTEAGHPGRSRA